MHHFNGHLDDFPLKFSVGRQDKLPTIHWLPKLHKRSYKARFIANSILSSSCAATELSNLLTSYLTAVKPHVTRYGKTVYERSNKNWLWTVKLSRLKSRGFCPLTIFRLCTQHYLIIEPRHEKTGFLQMRKQRRRSALR